MAVTPSLRAFVVDVRDYRETSALVRLLVEGEGLVSLVGRGVRSARKGGGAHPVQPFALVQVVYSMRGADGLGSLRGAESERQYGVLRNDVESYGLAAAWFEAMLAAAQPGAEGAVLFALTEGFMDRLDRVGGIRDAGVLWHWARLLECLGVGAHFASCGRCGKPGPSHHFDVRRAESLCDACADARRRYLPMADAETRALAPVFDAAPPDAQPAPLARGALRLFLRIVREVLRAHLDLELKSFRFLGRVMDQAGGA